MENSVSHRDEYVGEAEEGARLFQRWGNENAVYRKLFTGCETGLVYGRIEPGSDVPKSLTVDIRRCESVSEVDLNRSTMTYRGEVVKLQDASILSAHGGMRTARLIGNEGDNDLRAGAAGCEMTGGKGADHLSGGNGADRFVYNSLAESNLKNGYDSIYDFECGKDKIVLNHEGWYPEDTGEPMDHNALKSELIEITSRGQGWWQVSVPGTSSHDPAFYLMVHTDCPNAGPRLDDFVIT